MQHFPIQATIYICIINQSKVQCINQPSQSKMQGNHKIVSRDS